MTNKLFEATPTNMTALFNAMNMLTMAITKHLTQAQIRNISADLASMARLAESRGDTATETLLIDLHQSSLIGLKSDSGDS